MSAHRTTRRAILAGAATLSAATAITTGAASAGAGDCSFPDLVAKFIKVRERWHAQQKIDAIGQREHDDLFREIAGFPIEEWRDILVNDRDDPRREQARAALNEIGQRQHHLNCVTEDAWNEIHGELYPLAKEVLSRTPHSLTDLAWQAEVIFVRDAEYYDDDYGDELDPDNLVYKFLHNVHALGGLS